MENLIFETHAHYDDEVYNEDRVSLLESMRGGGIGLIMNISADMESAHETIELTKRFDFIYGTIGVHPSSVGSLTETDFEWLKGACQLPKIMAIGEIGLDYHYPDPPKDVQKKWFVRQLEMARENNLPVIIHSRDAAKDTLDILHAEQGETLSAVVHCYSYSKETAKDFLDMGYYFGIGGVVTFPKAPKLCDTVEYLPIERILLETDCPYLAPVPHRGSRNSSLNLPYIATKIAEIKGMNYDDVVRITTENAVKFYGIRAVSL